MRASILKPTLQVLAQHERNVHIEGPPGVGKTQVARQAVRELGGWGFHQLHAPTLQPEDLGLPVFSEDRRTHSFTVPRWFPCAGDESIPERGVILIDEIAQADNPIQKTLANLLQEHELNGHPLKPGWSFFTTGNRKQDRAGANRILSHLSDRMIRVTFEPSLDDWVQWALTDGDVHPMVIGFLRFRPDLLLDFEPNRDVNATPRGWSEKVSVVLDRVAPEAEFEAIEGSVGTGPAAELKGFMEMYRKLPSPELIFSDPKRAPVPDANNVRYATTSMVAAHTTHDNIDAAITYAKRLPPEFTVLLIRDLTMKDPTLHETKAFIDWATSADSDVLM